uniref:Uncharacterized protein n=1 Tax=Anguilla anguilla TaxID=7936 RepID=A0A0E9PKI9_ANGAN
MGAALRFVFFRSSH